MFRRPPLHNPRDLGAWQRPPHRRQRGQRVHNVADASQFDEENTHKSSDE